MLISGSDGVVLNNLNIYPSYYPANITQDLPVVTESEINTITGQDGLKVYYNQIVDTLTSYNNGKQTSDTTIKNVTVKNCTIGDPDLAVEEWGSAIYFNGKNQNSLVGISGGYTIEGNTLYGAISICEDVGCNATAETCIIRDNHLHEGILLTGQRPTGWNYNSLTVFPTITNNTFYAAYYSVTDVDENKYDYMVGSRDTDATKVLSEEQLEEILANNTFAGSLSGKELGIAIGAHTYTNHGDEHHAVIYAK